MKFDFIRQRGQTGAAMIFALLALLLVGSACTYAIMQAAASERSAAESATTDKERALANAAWGLATDRLRQIGSTKKASLEGSYTDSPISTGVLNYNGVDGSDGTYQVKVSAGSCSKPTQRLLQVITVLDGHTRTQSQCINVAPRVLSYSLYAGRDLIIQKGINLLAYPAVVTGANPTSAPIGAGRNLDIEDGGNINYKEQGVQSNVWYQFQFAGLWTGMTDDRQYRYGTKSKPGPIWPTIIKTPSETVNPFGPASVVNLGFSTSTADDQVSYPTDNVIPDWEQEIPGWTAAAAGNDAANPGPRASGDGRYTGTEFQAIQDDPLADRSVRLNFYGIIMVTCGPGDPDPIDIKRYTRINGGGIIFYGCNVREKSTESLESISIDGYPNAATLWKMPNYGKTCTPDSGELPDIPAQCRWLYPGMAVIRNTSGAGSGGDLNIQYGNNTTVRFDGSLLVSRDMTVDPLPGLQDGWWMFGTVGSTVVGRDFKFLNPLPDTKTFIAGFSMTELAQRLGWDPYLDEASMGTYTIRSKDPQQSAAPVVVINTAPPDGNAAPSFTVAWVAAWNPTSVYWRLDDGPWTQLLDPSVKTQDLVGIGANDRHTFTVKACNAVGCGRDSVSWTQS